MTSAAFPAFSFRLCNSLLIASSAEFESACCCWRAVRAASMRLSYLVTLLLLLPPDAMIGKIGPHQCCTGSQQSSANSQQASHHPLVQIPCSAFPSASHAFASPLTQELLFLGALRRAPFLARRAMGLGHSGRMLHSVVNACSARKSSLHNSIQRLSPEADQRLQGKQPVSCSPRLLISMSSCRQ